MHLASFIVLVAFRLVPMLTRRRAKEAAAAAVSVSPKTNVSKTLGGGQSTNTAADSNTDAVVSHGDETDVEELDMDVCEMSDGEADDGVDVVDDDDFEVAISRFQPRSASSPSSAPLLSTSRVRPAPVLGTANEANLVANLTKRVQRARNGTSEPLRYDAAHMNDDEEVENEVRMSSRGSGTKRVKMAERVREPPSDAMQGAAARTYAPPVKWIKPDKFSASTPIESYLSHFETISAYNQWTLRDKAAHLKASLSGDAAQVLWDGGDHATITYDELVSKLKARFGSADHRERFACQLRSLRRQPGQTLQQLYNEVKRLMTLAYSSAANSELGETIARDAFLSALGDRELEIKVRDREPIDLDTAFRAASRIETYFRLPTSDIDRDHNVRGHRDRYDGQRARQVTGHAETTTDETTKALRDLRDQLARSRKTQDELSRELGRMRLLAECQAAPRNGNDASLGTNSNSDRLMGAPTQTKNRGRGGNNACFACGDPTHYIRDCPTKRPGSDSLPRNDKGLTTDDSKNVVMNRQVTRLSDGQLDRAAYLRMRVGGEWTDVLLDSGSEICLFPGRYAEVGTAQPQKHRLYAANGTAIAVAGEIELAASIGSLQLDIKGLCSHNVSEVILGLNFLRANEAIWDFKTGRISLRGQRFDLQTRDVKNACRRVILESDVELPPRSEVIAPAYIQLQGNVNAAGDWAICSRHVTGRVHTASALLPNRLVDVPVRILNAGDVPATLTAGTTIAKAERVTIGPNGCEGEGPIACKVRDEMIAEMVARVDKDVPAEVRDDVTRLVQEYAGAFSFDDLDVGHAIAAEHTIDVGDARPVRQRLRRQPPAHQAAIDAHVTDMLRQGIIEPTQSPWAANLVVVRKKSGEYRICVDFRGLNQATRKDAYSLPRIDSCLDALSGAKWFSTFDLRNSYYQVELAKEDRDKTAFICRGGQYRYIRRPMGLCNSGATFQRLVDVTLSGLSYDICLAYIDDIIVYSRSLPEHLSRLRMVLDRLQAGGLKIKPSKSFLLQRSVGFLGHLISADGISAHPEKTEQILNWGTPQCVRDVRAFIGITSYYRKFVKNYAAVASPLTGLTAKNKVFVWSAECQTAFETLKRALASTPILAMPIDGGKYVLDTDSSDFAIGAVLSQQQGEEERVIAYASRHLSPRERNYCVTRRELLAVVYYLKYFRHYLLGAAQTVKVRTDHAAIQWLRRIPEPVGQQARWLELMEEFDIEIEHRAGRLHNNADAMSRDPCYNRRCCPNFGREADAAAEQSPGCRSGVEVWAEGHEEKAVAAPREAEVESESAVKGTSEVPDDEENDSRRVARTRRAAEPSTSADIQCDDVAMPWRDDRFLAERQRADPNLSKIIELLERGSAPPTWDEIAPLPEHAKILWRQWQRLSLRDGILIRRFDESNGRRCFWQLVLPKQMRTEFLSAIHAGVGGGHFGRHRTELAVKARAYWPGWAGDVRRALRTCAACTRYQRGKPSRQVALKPILCGEPWELLSLDITGPHTTSKQGYSYILTMQDHFSKWAEAVPIRRHTAPIVARIVFEQIFMRFGAPRRILTDQGPEFESEMIAELCRIMRVVKVRTTPYHPQCNGMLERMHRVLNAMLAKIIDGDQRNWPDHLPSVMAAYRASVHEATGYTPNMLVLGMETRLPIDLVYGLPPDRNQEKVSYDEFVDERAERVNADFRTVRENLGRLAQLRMDKYDIKRDIPPLVVGQKVWYFCPRRKPNLSPKWQNFYTGPFTVVRVIDPHVIVISRSRRSRPFAVHRDKLKPVIEGDEMEISVQPFGEMRTDDNSETASILPDAENNVDMRRRPQRERREPKKFGDFCRAVCVVSQAGEAMPPSAVPGRWSCDTCGTSYRDECDLTRHRRTKAHLARCAGRSPPARSRCGDSE